MKEQGDLFLVLLVTEIDVFSWKDRNCLQHLRCRHMDYAGIVTPFFLFTVRSSLGNPNVVYLLIINELVFF